MNETTIGQNVTLIVARLLLVSVFLGSLMGKVNDPGGTQAYMAAKGMPMESTVKKASCSMPRRDQIRSDKT